MAAYIAIRNECFACPTRDETPAHHPRAGTVEAPDNVLTRPQERTLSQSLTLWLAGTQYCVRTSRSSAALRRARAAWYYLLGSGMTTHHRERGPPVTAYSTYSVPDPAENETTIGVEMDAVVAAAQAESVQSRSKA